MVSCLMRIDILVKPHCQKEGIETLPDGSYRISVLAPARDGRANEAVIELLSEYFSVPKSKIQIVKGVRGKKKRVEVTIPGKNDS